jgi:hypothetical protein
LLSGKSLSPFSHPVGSLPSAEKVMKLVGDPMLTWVVFSISMGAAICGAQSACLWYRASRVQASPTWVTNGGVEPGDPGLETAQWLAALITAAQESANLNAKAAGWTAAAVGLTAFAAMATAAAAFLVK